MRNIVKYLFCILLIINIFLFSINCFANSKVVTPTKSKIFLDFEQVYFETYLIDGYNYFKLRDLAYVFNDTNKAFQVQWNGELNRIDILINNSYSSIGTEMQDLNPNKEKKNATLTTSDIYVNNVKKEFNTYLIDGYNYFKLRDVLKLIDCGVTYDEKTQYINIYTAWPYISDEYIKLPILMYHHLDTATDGSNSMIITPSKFENDIISILNKGYTPISFSELYKYVKDGYQLPQKPIIITFDDGYLSNYEYAFPILKKYNVKASIFPIVKYLEEPSPDYLHFDYVQAREMINSGLVEIYSHTYDMHNQISDDEAFYNDLIIVSDKFNKILQSELLAFAYPYGVHNDKLQKVVDRLGIKVTVTTQQGVNFVDKGDTDSLKLLNRYTVSQYTSIENLLTKVDNTERTGVK